MLAGAKGHPCGDEDTVRFPACFLPFAPGRLVGEDLELAPDGQGAARAGGIARPDMLRQLCEASAEAFDELFRRAFVAIRLDLERVRSLPRDECDLFGTEEA